MTNHTLEKPNDWWWLHLPLVIPWNLAQIPALKPKVDLPSSTERESTQSSAQTHTTIFIEKGPSTRAHDDGGGFSAQFRSKPGVDNMHPGYSHLFNYPKAN